MQNKPVLINRIKIILIEKGISQKELAEMWGKREEQVSLVCRNLSQPRVKDFPKLSKILGVSMNELIYDKKFEE